MEYLVIKASVPDAKGELRHEYYDLRQEIDDKGNPVLIRSNKQTYTIKQLEDKIAAIQADLAKWTAMLSEVK